MNAKSIKKGAKKGLPFRGGNVSKITKIRALGSKCAPSLQEGFPGTQNTQKSSKMSSKITRNSDNLVIHNQENPRQKKTRNGTVAGSRAAHWINKYTQINR